MNDTETTTGRGNEKNGVGVVCISLFGVAAWNGHGKTIKDGNGRHIDTVMSAAKITEVTEKGDVNLFLFLIGVSVLVANTLM